MENNSFAVYLQPIYDIRTSALCGAEALARRINAQGGTDEPAAFIPVMEKDGTILNLDMLMFENACKILARWRVMGLKKINLAVNMSQETLNNAQLAARLKEVLSNYNLLEGTLEVEVTETLPCPDFAALQVTIDQIRSLGLKVAIDDFGAAYSNIFQLAKLKADALKLDKSLLLCDTNSLPKTKKIITHMAAMAQDIGMRVVAEGVETLQHLDFLRATYCDSAQGFYFAKPMPEHNFTKLLEQQL